MERQVEIREVRGEEDVGRVRGLMREYGAYLAANPAGAANICIMGLERELEALPGKYVAPGGLWLGSVDGEAVGCVALRSLAPHVAGEESPVAEFALEVKRLWVRPSGRGVGLGRRLMASAMNRARQAGARRLYLDTVPSAMPEASALYRGLGFQPICRYNDNAVSGVEFFVLDLEPGGRGGWVADGGGEPLEVTE